MSAAPVSTGIRTVLDAPRGNRFSRPGATTPPPWDQRPPDREQRPLTREQRLPAQMQGDPRVAYRQAHCRCGRACMPLDWPNATPSPPKARASPHPHRNVGPYPWFRDPVPPRMTARSYSVLAGSFHRCRAAARVARTATVNPAARATWPGIWAATPWPP